MARKSVYDDSEAYIGLAIAICERAANDYRLLTRGAVGWWDAGMEEIEKSRIEAFFLSQFGELICFGRGEEIMEKLWREEARHETEIPHEYRV